MITGNELEKYRRSLGLTLADVARQLGTTVASLRRIESRGKQRVRGLVLRYEDALCLADRSWQGAL